MELPGLEVAHPSLEDVYLAANRGRRRWRRLRGAAGPLGAVATVRLLGTQVGYQLKLLARSPMAAFATLVIPLMVLLAVNLLYSGTRLSSRGGIPFAQFFTPAMVAFAVVNACYMSVISSTTLAREEGILKRIRGTPLPPWVYMAGRIVSSGLVAIVAAIVVVLAVGAGVYGFQVVWAGVPAALLTLAVRDVLLLLAGACGDACWCPRPTRRARSPGGRCCRCASSPMSSSRSTTPLHWLRSIASFFPLRPFADDLESAFNPVTGSSGDPSGASGADGRCGAWWRPPSRCSLSGGSRTGDIAAIADRDGRPCSQRTASADCSSRVAKAGPAVGGEKRLVSQSRIRHAAPTAARPRLATEWIEGPAPAEDSSVPPETAALPPPASAPGRSRERPDA